MMFPALVADLQQSGIAVRVISILKGCAHYARVCFGRLQTGDCSNRLRQNGWMFAL
jgi:hypothetical protein